MQNEVEMVRHVMSACEPLKWTMYKTRHDRVLYQVVLALCKRWDIKLPERLRLTASEWTEDFVVENSKLKLVVDASIVS